MDRLAVSKLFKSLIVSVNDWITHVTEPLCHITEFLSNNPLNLSGYDAQSEIWGLLESCYNTLNLLYYNKNSVMYILRPESSSCETIMEQTLQGVLENNSTKSNLQSIL